MILQIHQALNKWQKAEFDYGSVDCCQFAGFIVKELTGIDYLRDFAYESEQAAEQIIDGFGDLERTAASVLGAPTRDFESLADGSPGGPTRPEPAEDHAGGNGGGTEVVAVTESEEHTSELQSLE